MTTFTATFKPSDDEENEKDMGVFDKDKVLGNLIDEYNHLKSDIGYVRNRINRRIDKFFPKGSKVYIEAEIEDFDLHDTDQPIKVRTKEGTSIYLHQNDVINKDIFESPLGELMYGKISKGQDTPNNQE